jgi:hypothetical protein
MWWVKKRGGGIRGVNGFSRNRKQVKAAPYFKRPLN